MISDRHEYGCGRFSMAASPNELPLATSPTMNSSVRRATESKIFSHSAGAAGPSPESPDPSADDRRTSGGIELRPSRGAAAKLVASAMRARCFSAAFFISLSRFLDPLST